MHNDKIKKYIKGGEYEYIKKEGVAK